MPKVPDEVIEKLMTAESTDKLQELIKQYNVQDEAVIITAFGKLLN